MNTGQIIEVFFVQDWIASMRSFNFVKKQFILIWWIIQPRATAVFPVTRHAFQLPWGLEYCEVVYTAQRKRHFSSVLSEVVPKSQLPLHFFIYFQYILAFLRHSYSFWPQRPGQPMHLAVFQQISWKKSQPTPHQKDPNGKGRKISTHTLQKEAGTLQQWEEAAFIQSSVLQNT